MHVKKKQFERDMEQWTGSKLGKEYVKAVYCKNGFQESRIVNILKMRNQQVKKS